MGQGRSKSVDEGGDSMLASGAGGLVGGKVMGNASPGHLASPEKRRRYQEQQISLEDMEVIEEKGAAVRTGAGGRELGVREPAPPVFGSPIDTDSFMTSAIGKELPLREPVEKTDIENSLSLDSKEAMKAWREDDSCIPMVFRWDGGGNEAYLCGSFNKWETKVPMTNSHGDFTAIVNLPEGRHEYKFFVDGRWVHDPNEAISDNNLGSYNNVLLVTKKDFDTYFDSWELTAQKGASTPPGEYSQDVPPRSATSGLPPHLPPLLQQTVLNQECPSLEDPTLLYEPNHVILNHLYALSIKDHVLVLAATHRYREKYVTTLMYKPVVMHHS